jgi:SPOR domain
MKWIALTLLALNLIYYGWEMDQDLRLARANQAQALGVPAGVASLRLVRELKTPPAARADDDAPATFEPDAQAVTDAGMTPDDGIAAELQASTGAGPDELVNQLPELAVPAALGGTTGYSCFTFGPLPEEKHALWLADWFRTRMIPMHTRESQDADGSLLWVYLAPLPSAQEAEGVVQALQQKGVRDFRLISRGDLANAVSLGLFASQQAVNERLGELREKGFQPVVVPYAGVQRVHWIDVRIPAGDPVLQEMFSGFPGRYSSIPAACDQIALDQPPP